MKTLLPISAVAAFLALTPAHAQLTLYEHDGFQGRTFSTDRPVFDFQQLGFNYLASSVIVDAGRWEVCEDAGFSGHVSCWSPDSTRRSAPSGAMTRFLLYGPWVGKSRLHQLGPPAMNTIRAMVSRPSPSGRGDVRARRGERTAATMLG